MTEACRTEKQEQVHLGDPEFDVLAGRRKKPFLGRRNMFVSKRVTDFAPREQATPIDPGTVPFRYGHVGRHRAHPVRHFAVPSGAAVQDPPESLLG